MKTNYEKYGLIFSIIGGLILGILGIVVAVFSRSDAIFLDGAYTLINVIITFFSIKIIFLLKQPESKKHPLGFVAFEPFIIVVKSLIILFVSAMAIFDNVETFLNGGRDLKFGLIGIYVFVSVLFCLIIAIILHKFSKKENSQILNLEFKSWLIDGAISSGIGVAIIFISFVSKTPFFWMTRYADQVLVVIIVIMFLPTTIIGLVKSFNHLLLISHENIIERRIKKHIDPLIEKYNLDITNVYGLKIGRQTNAVLYTKIHKKNITITLLDEIRKNIKENVEKNEKDFYIEIIFTNYVGSDFKK